MARPGTRLYALLMGPRLILRYGLLPPSSSRLVLFNSLAFCLRRFLAEFECSTLSSQGKMCWAYHFNPPVDELGEILEVRLVHQPGKSDSARAKRPVLMANLARCPSTAVQLAAMCSDVSGTPQLGHRGSISFPCSASFPRNPPCPVSICETQ